MQVCRPGYPSSGLRDLDYTRAWVLRFVRWYNDEHHHSGLSFLTPEQRHGGRGEAILKQRKEVYEAAKA